MTKLGPDTNPAGMNGWQIEASPPNAGTEHPCTVKLVSQPVGRGAPSRLTSAGLVAVASQITGYLTQSKLDAMIARTGGVHFYIARNLVWYMVLPEDGPAQITAMAALFQTAANVTTS